MSVWSEAWPKIPGINSRNASIFVQALRFFGWFKSNSLRLSLIKNTCHRRHWTARDCLLLCRALSSPSASIGDGWVLWTTARTSLDWPHRCGCCCNRWCCDCCCCTSSSSDLWCWSPRSILVQECPHCLHDSLPALCRALELATLETRTDALCDRLLHRASQCPGIPTPTPLHPQDYLAYVCSLLGAPTAILSIQATHNGGVPCVSGRKQGLGTPGSTQRRVSGDCSTSSRQISQNWHRNGRLGPARRVVSLSAVCVLGLVPTLALFCCHERLQLDFAILV